MCAINGGVCRAAREKTRIDLLERETSHSAFFPPHGEDAIKRITFKDLTISLVQMGSLKLQFTRIWESQRHVAK